MNSEYIVIGFSKAKGFKPVSKAIMLVEGTDYSHTYIKVENTYFNDCDIYQASKGLVNHMTLDVFLEHNEIVEEYKIPVTKEKKKDIIKFLRKRLGKPYSCQTLVAIFIITQLRHLGIKWSKLNNLFDGEKAYICSELVARVVKEFDLADLDFNVDSATPKQIREVFKNYERNN